MILTFQPLIGAIAAGCTAVLKPSELVPTFSQLLEEIVPKYLDPNVCRVVNGAVPETSELLELQWDHIFYTGNGRVARIIASAAAKHLTPLSLELGGKSPVIIDSAYDIDLAAKRILWGKCNNAGQVSLYRPIFWAAEREFLQICVAPDYVLVQRDKQDELVKAFQKHYNAFFPDGALDSPLFGSIVSELHHKRLTSLLSRTKGEIVLQGRADAARRRLEPTIVKDVADGDSLLEESVLPYVINVILIVFIENSLVRYCLSYPWILSIRQLTSLTHGKLSPHNPTRQLMYRTKISSTSSVRF
jgi:aldehyde dehydrogenase (NAD+)